MVKNQHGFFMMILPIIFIVLILLGGAYAIGWIGDNLYQKDVDIGCKGQMHDVALSGKIKIIDAEKIALRVKPQIEMITITKATDYGPSRSTFGIFSTLGILRTSYEGTIYLKQGGKTVGATGFSGNADILGDTQDFSIHFNVPDCNNDGSADAVQDLLIFAELDSDQGYDTFERSYDYSGGTYQGATN